MKEVVWHSQKVMKTYQKNVNIFENKPSVYFDILDILIDKTLNNLKNKLEP